MHLRFTLMLGLLVCLYGCSDSNDNVAEVFSFADEPGALAAGTRTDVVLRDTERARDITATLWYPTDGSNQGPLQATEGASLIEGDQTFPIVVLVHGITDDAGTWDYLGPHLASHGYVVLAPSTGSSPATGSDIVNHPGDISFLIDAALGDNTTLPMFNQRVERDDILVGGFSFGGLATYLLAYEQQYQDDRVKAVIIFAGAVTNAPPVNPNLTLLGMYGTDDPLVRYDSGLNLYEAANAPKYLVTLQGGGHLGFTASIQSSGAGTMEHLRQKSLTRITVLAFAQALFADSAAQRSAAANFLQQQLAADNLDTDVMFELLE